MAKYTSQRKQDAKRRKTRRKEREIAIPPTPEHLTRRREASGGDESVADEFPLHVLHARGLIEYRQKQAGELFAAARYRAHGRPAGSVEAVYKRMVAGFKEWEAPPPALVDLDEDELYQRNKAAYRLASEALKSAGQLALNITMRVAVYLERPVWATTHSGLGPLRVAEREALKAGLTALADHYGLAKESKPEEKAERAA